MDFYEGLDLLKNFQSPEYVLLEPQEIISEMRFEVRLKQGKIIKCLKKYRNENN